MNNDSLIRTFNEGFIEKLGDTHNGSGVFLTEVNSEFLVCKPRDTTWEVLFFSKQSPIKNHFKNVFNVKNIFYLDYLFQSDLLSVNRFLKSSESVENTNVFLSNFLDLALYASIWGIADCHSENIIVCNNVPVIVDAECVLANHYLPSKSFLIPPIDSSGKILINDFLTNYIKSDQLKSLSEFYKNHIVRNLKNFHQCWEAFSKSANYIQGLYSKKIIRILLRDTKDYMNIFDHSNLAEIEKKQLAHSNIPYFYVYFDKYEEIFYKINKVENMIKVTDLPDTLYENYINNKPALSHVFFQIESFAYRYYFSIVDLLNFIYWFSEENYEFRDQELHIKMTKDEIYLKHEKNQLHVFRHFSDRKNLYLSSYYGKNILDYSFYIKNYEFIG